jgi:hypothetical protein
MVPKIGATAKELTEREQALLEALADYDEFGSVLVIQYKYPRLKIYSKHELFHSAGVLVKLGLALRAVANPERETKYRISDEGRKREVSLLAHRWAAWDSTGDHNAHLGM